MNNELFEYLGSGSSRKVYAINDDWVLKLPKNTSLGSYDLVQCQTEIDTYIKYKDKVPLAKIDLKLSSKERIVMQRLKPFDVSDEPWDYNYSDWFDDLIELISYRPQDVEQHLKDRFSKTDPVVSFAKKLRENLTQAELQCILYDVGFENCGLNEDGEVVILDYGLVDD